MKPRKPAKWSARRRAATEARNEARKSAKAGAKVVDIKDAKRGRKRLPPPKASGDGLTFTWACERDSGEAVCVELHRGLTPEGAMEVHVHTSPDGFNLRLENGASLLTSVSDALGAMGSRVAGGPGPMPISVGGPIRVPPSALDIFGYPAELTYTANTFNVGPGPITGPVVATIRNDVPKELTRESAMELVVWIGRSAMITPEQYRNAFLGAMKSRPLMSPDGMEPDESDAEPPH